MLVAIGQKHADKPIRSRSEKHADRISSDEKIYLIIQIRPAQRKPVLMMHRSSNIEI